MLAQAEDGIPLLLAGAEPSSVPVRRDAIEVSRLRASGAIVLGKANLDEFPFGDFGISRSYNLVHGSDSPESAQRELELWFG